MEEYSVKPGQTFKKPAGSLTVTQIINATITKLGKADLPKALNISDASSSFEGKSPSLTAHTMIIHQLNIIQKLKL